MGFSDRQLEVIESEKKNILVSASAGSGKTTVMMERVVNLMSKTKTPLKRFVIVTFTKDAAADMKKKLRQKLIEKISDDNVENKDFLREELFRLESANISTLHSFCQTIIKSYFEKAGVSPVFSVIDDVEATTLKNECLNDVFSTYYDKVNPKFISLLSAMNNRAEDDKLKDVILDIYEFFKINEKSLDEVINDCLKQYDDISASKKFLHEYINSNNKVLLDDLYLFKAIFKGNENLLNVVDEFEKMLMPRDTLEGAIKALKFPNVRLSVSKKSEKEVLDAYEVFRDTYKPLLKEYSDDISSKIYKSDELYAAEAKEAKVNITLIFDIVKEFDKVYSKKKQDMQVLDFNDLEKKMLEVLQDNDTLQILNETYKYVFVDEYQDINYLQENILSKIAKSSCLLMVGDAKQSIYGFRQCKPEIFINKRTAFIEQVKADCEAIELNDNYRSKISILEFVNCVFKNIMKEEFSGINYLKDAMLSAGLESQKISDDEPVTIDLVKLTFEGRKPTASDYRPYYIDLIEKHVKELLGSKYTDIRSGEEKTFEEKDICILSRTKNHLEDIYLHFLNKGVQLDISYEKDTDNIPEISVLYCLIKTISNPKDDISFISTIRNIYGLTDSDLLIIATQTKATERFDSFFDKALKCTNKDVKKKIDEIIESLDKYRFLAQSRDTSDILYSICSENGYFNRLLQMEDGQNRKNRVTQFILSLKGEDIVSNIFKFAPNIDENKIKLSVLGSGSGIKLRTIHSSKGLEYPAVILSDADRLFRKDKGLYNVDRELGVGYNYYNDSKKVYSDSIVKTAIRYKKNMQGLEEELRLLYVALTRAKNKLIIIGKDVDGAQGLQSPLRMTTNFMPWIKQGLSCARIYKYSNEDKIISEEKKYIGKVDKELKERLTSQLNFKYKYIDDSNKLRKTSVVSYNVHNIDDLEYIESPFEIKEGKIERGNAYHKFMEHVDYNKDIASQLKNLKNTNVFVDDEYSYLDEIKLKRLLSMPIFDEIRQSRYYREHPFMMLNKEGQLIQGIIDMFYIKDGKAYLLDYKYSSLTDDSLKKVYSPQLKLYKKAIEDILKLKVEKVMLLNLNTEHLIEL